MDAWRPARRPAKLHRGKIWKTELGLHGHELENGNSPQDIRAGPGLRLSVLLEGAEAKGPRPV